MRTALVALVMAAGVWAQGWTRHNDPLGFTVQHPPGWKVQAAADGLVRVASADASAFVLVQPFLLRQPASARQWLAQSPGLFAAQFPQGRILKVQQRSARPDQAVAALAYTGGRATLLATLDGRAGMLYAIAAPEREFPARRVELVRVLESFRYTQPAARARPAAGGGPKLDYVRWEDPRERAFSIEAPRGWNVQGGTFRFASVDTRAAVEMASPDGQVRITSGDAEIPTYTLPTPMLAMAGFREGSWYSPGYGVRMIVRRYVPGVRFAQEYAEGKVASGCPQLAVVDSRDRPDLAQALGRLLAPAGGYVSQQLTTGEVSFTCNSGGRPMRGYYFAGTVLTGTQGTGLWNVQHLCGWVAAAGREATAQAAFDHMIASIRINPEWARAQQHLTAQTSEIVARTHAEISRGISESYWARQRVYDDLSRKWSNVILGQTDVVDPETGEKWKVAAGHNYYWRKEGTDSIVGTGTYTPPDIDFTPLKEW